MSNPGVTLMVTTIFVCVAKLLFVEAVSQGPRCIEWLEYNTVMSNTQLRKVGQKVKR